MFKTFRALICLWLCGLICSAPAADYGLADGTTLSGDIISVNDVGVILRLGDAKYTDRMLWTKFSQSGLKQFAEDPKIRPLVEPFIAPPPTERTQPTDNIKIQPVTRLDLPPHRFILGALASSSVGLFLLFLIYAANLYAAYELAVCRGRPLGTVMGVSAVLPVVGPVIFFALPSTLQEEPAGTAPGTEAEAAGAPAAPGADPARAAADANPSAAVAAAVAAAAQAARANRAGSTASEPPVDPQLEGIQISALSATPPKEAPVTQSFKRGQFTFNRRFFETKFAGFFAPVRSEADQKLEFTVKIPQGYYVVQRIARLEMNEVHFEVLQDQQPQNIPVPFSDIQEITIKTKTA